MIRHILLFTFMMLFNSSYSQECKTSSYAFNAGESLSYSVYYSWGVIWVEAGVATFSVRSEMISTLPVYHFKGEGKTIPKYDWFYKVNDVFEAYADTVELKPFRYIRKTHEGGNSVYNDSYFNYRKGEAYCLSIDPENKVSRDTCKVNKCSKDVLTMIYYARSLNFEKYKPGDKIPVSLYLDGKLYSLYIKYGGKTVLTSSLGTFNCIKFSPLLVPGTIFKEGDEMNVWVTDDQNRIPIYIETPIVVGSVKVKIKSVKGNKYPLIPLK